MSEKNLVLCVLLEKGSIFIFAGNTVIQGFKRLGSSEYVLKYIAVVFLSEMGGGDLTRWMAHQAKARCVSLPPVMTDLIAYCGSVYTEHITMFF